MANKTSTTNAEQAQWFSVYKPTQGYWTRLCTALGSAALVAWGAHWLFQKMEPYGTTPTGQYLQVGVTLLWIVAWALVLYWLIGRNARTVDFFVAVESEMKKVNWSSKQEVIGATKVVMLFVVLLSLMLFAVDILFMLFFSAIGVLREAGSALF